MIITVKLRRIGNSLGVIIPARQVEGFNAGDNIRVEVITSDDEALGDVITKIELPIEVITKHIDNKPDVITTEVGVAQLKPRPPVKAQSTNPLMVGYVPPK